MVWLAKGTENDDKNKKKIRKKGTYATESFNLFNIVGEDSRLGSLVVTVELWEVVHLDIILDAIS